MKLHFIAIGGAIMHQLAIVSKKKGHEITGSDDYIADPAKSNLQEANLLPQKEGWFEDKIVKDLDALILGMHAKKDNPELIKAQELGLQIYSFPEYIYELSKEKKRIVIAGSHGKTTTTAMIMHVLKDLKLDFDYLVGAKVEGFQHSVHISDAAIILIEGDEYPASPLNPVPKIHFYHPHVSVITGIAWDHVNVFTTYENYWSQFKIFLDQMKGDEEVIYNSEDPEVERLIQSSSVAVNALPYSTLEFEVRDGHSFLKKENGTEIELQIFGKHNLQNMEAARLVCDSLGIEADAFFQSIKTFTGAARRLEKLEESDQFISFRDFAHAPSKLTATLSAVREQFPKHHLIACFELHTFSSLNKEFLNQYAHSMDPGDASAVFFSSEALSLKGLPNLEAEEIKENFQKADLMIFSDKNKLKDWIQSEISGTEKPVCLLLMSSGTFEGLQLSGGWQLSSQ